MDDELILTLNYIDPVTGKPLTKEVTLKGEEHLHFEFLMLSIKEFEDLPDEDKDKYIYRDITMNCDKLGNMFYKKEEYEFARMFYKKAMNTSINIYGYNPSPYSSTDTPHATDIVRSSYSEFETEDVGYIDFTGMIFVLTGFYDNDKEKICNDILKLGGMVKYNLDKYVNYLVVPDEPIRLTRSIKNATMLEVPIITYSELYRHIHSN